jgi:hypothetical protein
MSASLEFHYPAGGSYTHHWTPASNPSLGSTQERLSGYVGDLMSDGVTEFVYQIADPRWKYTLNFGFLSKTDRDAVETVFGVVGGSAFDYKDGACGPVTSYQKVQLAPECMRRVWTTSAAGRFSGTIVLLEAA